MNYIKGKYRKPIFENANGYKVGLFKVKEVSDDSLNEIINKTITFTGFFNDLNTEETYVLHGEYTFNDKYGYQFKVDNYERQEIEGTDAIIEFLSSSLIKGSGEKTAMKIVEYFGEDAINKIKENKANLLLVGGITEKRANDIYNSIMKYQESDELIVYLKTLGFTMKEALKLIGLYQTMIKNIIDENIYELVEVLDFNKLDKIFLLNNSIDDPVRIKACIVETLKRLSFMNGDTYTSLIEIYDYLKSAFKITLEETELNDYLQDLNQDKIVKEKDKYYLKEYYDEEEYISESLFRINSQPLDKINNFDTNIKIIENELNVKYNEEQKSAIKMALANNVSIITGGPGTGKTTLIRGYLKMYVKTFGFDNNIVLLSPTGKASKRMCEICGYPAYTIHRYLKWNKEDNTFEFNEDYKRHDRLIIIDETSMVDTFLLASLLKGIEHRVKLVFVGDSNQLPSVGPGNILSDLTNSCVFAHTELFNIYRQSGNSYIPLLASEIKNKNLSNDFNIGKDDFRFVEVGSNYVKDTLEQILTKTIEKHINVSDFQVLIPMYKGENGIDNINILLQKLFNPANKNKNEIFLGDVIYREGDKVIQLVNDVDNNVYNGDIGIIKEINLHAPNKKIMTINFDGNLVLYRKEDLYNIKHAYVISIHKSQGSEFDHVIMPIISSYNRMLYNKLIYTGVSRAKKSLTMLGSIDALKRSIMNDYSINRKTTLMSRLMHIFSKK